MKQIQSKSFTVLGPMDEWLGQIVITSDGLFASVTDYGNLSFAWRGFGDDFRLFLTEINEDYFATKLFSGMSYILHDKKTESACKRFSRMILPPLQLLLQKDIEENPIWQE